MINKNFRVVALLTCRNESLYIDRCLRHLKEQEIETCIIDNESTDNTMDIVRKYLNNGVFRIEKQTYNGYFDLVEQLRIKENLAEEIDADWFIHQDADEIREAIYPFKNLREGIFEVDKAGYNAINFKEFVFLPTSPADSFEGKDYVEEMIYYYYHEPWKNCHIKAWKKPNTKTELISSAGHLVRFENMKLYPQDFILRHYIALSKDHVIKKYFTDRTYSEKEILERKWHGSRAHFTPDKLNLPSKEQLKSIKSGAWDISDVWKRDLFLGDKPKS